jgi:serine/threonine-protein kinase
MREDRYKIIGVLGEGGMGTVYLAEDRRLPGKKWAIKEIREGAPGSGALREAAALAGLSHPGLPQVADYFESEDGKCGFLVMEHIEGETMEERFVRCGRKVDAAAAVRWAVQLCDVLGYLHGIRPHPVIHRDLKPSNVLITAQDRVVLIDFGISRLEKGTGQDTVRLGTIGFAAPELLARGRTDPRSDLYSLGAVLFYLLSGGRHPAALARPAAEELENVPFGLRQIVGKLLEPDPDRRYSDAESVKTALQAVMAELSRSEAGKEPSGAGGAGRKRLVAVLSLYPGAGSTVAVLAMAALMARRNLSHAVLEHPAAEPVLDGWLDPAVLDGRDGGTLWLTAGHLRERYGEWNDTVQLQALLEADAQVIVADLSHGWEEGTAERLLALADETVIVAGSRSLPLASRPVRENVGKAAFWLEAGRSVTLFWNGASIHPDPRIAQLPFRAVVRLPHCPELPVWECSGNPDRMPDDPELRPWLGRIDDWLLGLFAGWRIPVETGRRRKSLIFWKKGIDNLMPDLV